MSRRRRAADAQDAATHQVAQAALLLSGTARDVPALADEQAFGLWLQLITTQTASLTAAITSVGVDDSGVSPVAAIATTRDQLSRSIEDYRNMGAITPPVSAEQSSGAVTAVRVHADEMRAAAEELERSVAASTPPAN